MTKISFIEQIKQGDKKALTLFVNDNQDMVYRMCLAYVQNEADAQDLTQNVFIKAFEKLDTYKGNSKLSTWLTRIAINMSINFLRDNKKRLDQVDISTVAMADTSSKNSRETKKAVRKAIFNLPEKQRKVFILHFYLELPYKEICDVTGYSPSSVESLLFRARKKLKDLLSNYYKEIVLTASF